MAAADHGCAWRQIIAASMKGHCMSYKDLFKTKAAADPSKPDGKPDNTPEKAAKATPEKETKKAKS